MLVAGITAINLQQSFAQTKKTTNGKTTTNNAGLKLPPGFNATVVAPNVGGARHIAVTKEGDIYVKLARPDKDKNAIIMISKGGETKGFADYGGTGMYIKDGYLYASSNFDVYRYKLDAERSRNRPG